VDLATVTVDAHAPCLLLFCKRLRGHEFALRVEVVENCGGMDYREEFLVYVLVG
jgi:hypothetical protein